MWRREGLPGWRREHPSFSVRAPQRCVAHTGPALDRAVSCPPWPGHQHRKAGQLHPGQNCSLCSRPTSPSGQQSTGLWAKCLWTETSPFNFNSYFYTEQVGVFTVPAAQGTGVLPPMGYSPCGLWAVVLSRPGFQRFPCGLHRGTVWWAASPYILGPLDRAAGVWHIHQPARAGQALPVCAEALRGTGQCLA